MTTDRLRSVAGLKIYEHTPELLWLGIFGFTELRDGQVWAYGGTTHMGSTDGFIWRVDTGKSEELYRLDNAPLIRHQMDEAGKAAGIEEPEPKSKPRPKPEPPFPTDRPCLPITHVVEDPATGAILVVSFSDIYRTNARLDHWENVHELKMRYRGGRRDAVGAYPSIRSVLPIEEPGKPTALLFATRLDGLIRLVQGKETGHSLPGQLSAESVEHIETSSEGLLVFDGSDACGPSRYVDGAWNEVSFAPPFEPADPTAIEDQVEPKQEEWQESVHLVGRDGSIVTINSAGWIPGTRTTARWRNGKSEVLGREILATRSRSLLLDSRWTDLECKRRRLTALRRRQVEQGCRFRLAARCRSHEVELHRVGAAPVHDAGPPWVLYDRRNELLLRLSYRPGFTDPRMEVLPLSEGGQRLNVRDAISWTKDQLLLATDRGLRTFAMNGGQTATPPLNAGGRTVSHLVRDGRGRLWLGGEGLAVLDADGTTLHPLDDLLPMPGRSKIDAMAADPAHPEGAIAAVENRGVVFVRVGTRTVGGPQGE